MKRAIQPILIFMVLSACAGHEARQGVPDDPLACGATRLLTGDGIGDFRVGASVDQVRARCDVVFDTSLKFGTEGMPERRLAVNFGHDTVQATVDRDSVWRIEVLTPAFRTRDSIGVRSKFADLRGKGIRFLGYGEGGPFVSLADDCGLSFELENTNGLVRKLADIPPGATVSRVLVLGCQRK
jgi:hypothetical protein